jgi:hypothetical protein
MALLHGLPGEGGKTKPLGAALALKAAGTALHHRPEALDDRTRPTLAQINFAYPTTGPALPEGDDPGSRAFRAVGPMTGRGGRRSPVGKAKLSARKRVRAS